MFSLNRTPISLPLQIPSPPPEKGGGGEERERKRIQSIIKLNSIGQRRRRSIDIG